MMEEFLQAPANFMGRLDDLPDDLGHMYTNLLREHAARSGTTEAFQVLVLGWVTHSLRPLRLIELTSIVKSLPDRGGLKPSHDAKLAVRTTW